jgi:tetratricopeptide (TPR) repeat protein
VIQGKPDDAANLLWPTAQADPSVRNELIGFIANSFPPAQAEHWLNRMNDLLKKEKNSESSQLDLFSAWDTLAFRSGDRRYAQIAENLVVSMEQVPSVAGDAEFNEGVFREENNDYARAEKAYRNAIQHNQTPAKNNLAMLLAHHGGSLTEAIELARQCVKDDPNQATYWDTLSELLSQDRQFDPAVTAIRAAIRLEPDRAKWRVNLANILILDGHPDQARRIVADLDLMSPGIHSLTKEQLDRLDAVRKILANSSAASITH